jgi:hypothetical protein
MIDMRLANLGDTGSQHCHRNYYCPTCKCFGWRTPHEEGCVGEKVMISATARIPRKNASKKTWDEFYDKFVLQKDLKEFLSKPKKESKSMKTWRIRRKLKSFDVKINKWYDRLSKKNI